MSENITMFNENNKIVEYKCIQDYINYFIEWRLSKYTIRKEYYVKLKEDELNRLSEKYRFIMCVLEGKLKLDNNMTKDKLNKFLDDNKFTNKSELINLPVYVLTKDEAEKLKGMIAEKEKELETYKNTTPKDIWISEIKELLAVL